mgnify:FL=1|tara:strand:+ start:165 stop:1076 length:912 start_codon:yes stop_codon:yes gene_type:complete
MTDTAESQGNPEIGMQADSFEAAEAQSNEGSEAFFNDLEQQVNGGIIDETAEVTQQEISGSEQVTHNTQSVGSENVETPTDDGTDWKKRYEDSSREAVKLSEQYRSVEPFVPVLEAMKNDSGLVDHVRDYLKNGGKPAQSVQEQLGLDEDFVFDANDIADPDSDSAKVMNAHVDTMVQKRVGQMLNVEKQRAQQMQQAQARVAEEKAFMQKNNMNQDQFNAFKEKAQQHVMTLDDVNYLLNRNQNNTNVANSTKAEMLNQMKNVRNMPTSASGANSQGQQRSESDEVFDLINGFDNDVDNLFG